MKVLASGDHHFDEHSRFLECIKVHAFMVDVARSEGADLFISTGDIYERASTPKERKAVADWLVAMADVCAVLVIKGNHDRRLDLDLMRRISARNPVIVEEAAGVHYVAGAAVAAMAWPERALLAAAYREQSTGELDLTAQQSLQSVLRGLGADLARFDGPRIGAGHWMIDGSVTSVGQPLIGQSMNVGLSDLALLNAPLVVAGHIHAPQEWTYGECDVGYVGSPFRTSYGEVEEKSVVLAEFDGPKLLGWRRIPTPCAPMLMVTAHWYAEHFAEARVPPGLPGDVLVPAGFHFDEPVASVAGAEIRLRYHVDADHRDAAKAAAEEWKRSVLDAGALACKVEETVRSVNTARAPEVARALTLDAKLRAFWTARGTTPAEARAEKLLSKVHELEVA